MINNNFKLKSIAVLISATALLLLTGCSEDVIPESADTPEAAFVVQLTETQQRVLRWDCKDKLISDKIERVGYPNKYIAIHPTYEKWSKDLIQDSNFYNVNTDDKPFIVFDKYKFTISYLRDSDMRVQGGINEIRYRFKFADGYIEEKSRFINVKYQKVHVKEVLEVRPTKEECSTL